MKETEIDIRIVDISEVADMTRLYRWELLRLSGNPGKVMVQMRSWVDILPESHRLKVRVAAFYCREREMVRRRLLDFAVDAVFEVDEFDTHFGNAHHSVDSVDLPPSLLQMMFSVAVGALRGMIAQRVKGTPLEGRPLPFVDITSMVSRMIYPRRSNGQAYPLTDGVAG